DHAVHTAIAGHVNVENVGSRIEIKIEWRGFIEHAIVHHDLRALGLGFHADNSRIGILTATAEYFLEFSARSTNLIGVSKRLQCEVTVCVLPAFGADGAGFVKLSGPPNRDGV